MSVLPGIDFLLRLPRFSAIGSPAYRPGLERIRALLDGLHHPEEAFKSIHVAGTNGKGSTASMIASIGSALGLRIGLHTSPHLVDVTERMRLNGFPAPRDWLDARVERHRSLLERIAPSFFEATTALSFLYFAEAGADYAVVEVGMGGRLDATNVLQPEVAAITRIGLDHTEHLGNTLEAIAVEKAGIIKHGTPTVLYPAPTEVLDAVRAICLQLRSPLHSVDEEASVSGQVPSAEGWTFSLATPRETYVGIRLPLAGEYQLENAAIAVRSAELVWASRNGLTDAIHEGMASVRSRSGLRGRMEVLSREPLVIADVAHNPAGLESALETVHALSRRRGGRLHVILAAMADKDIHAIGVALASHAATVYCVSVEEARALGGQELASILRTTGVDVRGFGTLEDGMRFVLSHADPQDVILATGSYVVVGPLVAASDAGRLDEHFGTTFV